MTQLWLFLLGLLLSGAALYVVMCVTNGVSPWPRAHARQRPKQLALTGARQKEAAKTVLSIETEMAPAPEPRQPYQLTERDKLEQRRRNASKQVYNEWQDFEGLRDQPYVGRREHGGLASIEYEFDDHKQITVFILLYGLGHRKAMNHTAAAKILWRTRRSIQSLERYALIHIEGMLWNLANPSKKAVAYSKSQKVWLTPEEQEIAWRRIRNRQGLFITRQPETPHPPGICAAGVNARQWLQGEAHLVWMRKQRWAADNLPAATQRQPGKAVAAVSLS